jgi:hypothetical protein
MQSKDTKLVEQDRAAVLLGIPENELNRISGESGIGRREKHGGKQVVFFTYDELRKICMLSARPVH